MFISATGMSEGYHMYQKIRVSKEQTTNLWINQHHKQQGSWFSMVWVGGDKYCTYLITLNTEFYLITQSHIKGWTRKAQLHWRTMETKPWTAHSKSHTTDPKSSQSPPLYLSHRHINFLCRMCLPVRGTWSCPIWSFPCGPSLVPWDSPSETSDYVECPRDVPHAGTSQVCHMVSGVQI